MPVELATGMWWRYTRYEIRNGYIRPAAGAQLLRYDPWKNFWDRPGFVHTPPHLELANLVRELPADLSPFGPIQLSASLAPRVIDWCRAHGLLGLLPHQVKAVRIGAIRMYPAMSEPWFVTRQLQPEPDPSLSEIHLQPIVGEPTVEPASETWTRYFPDVPKDQSQSFSYPAPLSEKFWAQYGEPLDDFLRVAKYLANAIQRLRSGPGNRNITEYGDLVMNRAGAFARLNGLSRAQRQVYEAHGRRTRVRVHWVAPSLLGTLAAMAQQEKLEARFLKTCRCGRMFSSSRKAAAYCSEQHRELYKKRAQREKSAESLNQPREAASGRLARAKRKRRATR